MQSSPWVFQFSIQFHTKSIKTTRESTKKTVKIHINKKTLGNQIFQCFRDFPGLGKGGPKTFRFPIFHTTPYKSIKKLGNPKKTIKIHKQIHKQAGNPIFQCFRDFSRPGEGGSKNFWVFQFSIQFHKIYKET